MKLREAMRIVVVGMQGVGKSYETIRMMLDAAKGSPGVPPRKGLIFDTNDEFGDFEFEGGRMQIKSISLKDITLFTVHSICEIRRIRPFFDNGQPMTSDEKAQVLFEILEHFNNGIMLVEDINTYVSDNFPADIIGKIVSTRHRSTDMILHFQNVGRAGHPKIFANTSFIRMHKTNDPVSRHESKFREKTELLQIAEYIVDTKYKSGDERFFLWIDVVWSKIRGNFTKLDAEDAIHEYTSLNYNTTVKPYLLKRSKESGALLYDAKQAMEMAREEMMNKYFSFPSQKKI
jgi:hypothetical protein